MTSFTITRDAFTTTVQADDAQGAILAMVRDMGYATIADAADVLGESEQDFVDAQIVEEVEDEDEDDGDPSVIARACYWLAADGQGDVLLAGGGDQADLSDDELIEAAVAVGHDQGFIGDDEELRQQSEADFRGCLRIGEHRP